MRIALLALAMILLCPRTALTQEFYVKCQECGGDWKKPRMQLLFCKQSHGIGCDGTGKRRCFTCGGLGFLNGRATRSSKTWKSKDKTTEDKSHNKACPKCHGTGQITCPRCKGTGKYSGKAPCQNCDHGYVPIALAKVAEMIKRPGISHAAGDALAVHQNYDRFKDHTSLER